MKNRPINMSGEIFKDLYISEGKIFPNNVDRIIGNLDLNLCWIKKIENLPSRINGRLDLSNNKISKVENLPIYVDGAINLWQNNIIEFTPNKSSFSVIQINGFMFFQNDYERYIGKKLKELNLKKWNNL